MNADSIKIESDEDGFHMVVETSLSLFNFRIQDVAEELYDTVRREIEPWLYEKDMAASEAEARVETHESDAYDISDPKHVAFHSVHADIYDQEKT